MGLAFRLTGYMLTTPEEAGFLWGGDGLGVSGGGGAAGGVGEAAVIERSHMAKSNGKSLMSRRRRPFTSKLSISS